MPSSLIRNGEGADMNRSVNALSSDTNVGVRIAMALACQVKVLSSQQIAAIWGNDTCEESLNGTLCQLVESGLVTKSEWNVVPPPIDECPAFTWRPTDAAPDGWRLSKQFRLRWKQPTQPIEVFQATAQSRQALWFTLRLNDSDDRATARSLVVAGLCSLPRETPTTCPVLGW